MADLKTLCMDGSCMNVPQGGSYEFPVVHITSIEQLNAIDYPCMVYGDIQIPEIGYAGYDWNGIVIPTTGQISQFIDMGGDSWIRCNDNPPSGTWVAKPQTYVAGTNVQINGRTISATDTKYTASSATPLMDGTATAGTSANYAREGHRHPTDTTRAPLASPAFTGTPTAPTNGTASTSNTQIATTAFVQNAINRRLVKTLKQFKGDSQTVASSTEKMVNAITLDATGTFIGYAVVTYPSNATGIRSLQIYKGTTSLGSSLNVPACSGGVTILTVPIVVRGVSGEVLKMRLWQSSGSSLTTTVCRMFGIYYVD